MRNLKVVNLLIVFSFLFVDFGHASSRKDSPGMTIRERQQSKKTVPEIEMLRQLKSKLKALEGTYQVVSDDGKIYELSLFEAHYQRFLRKREEVSEERLKEMYGMDYDEKKVERDGFEFTLKLREEASEYDFEILLTDASFKTKKWLLRTTDRVIVKGDLLGFTAIYQGSKISWDIPLDAEGRMQGLELTTALSDWADTVLIFAAPIERFFRGKTRSFKVLSLE